MQITEHNVVSIHYILTNDHGDLLDSSSKEAPLMYMHGANNIIPGLEDALEGKKTGDALDVRVSPEQGYGLSIPELIQQVDRVMFQGVETIEAGMSFQAEDQSGYMQRVHVTGVDGDVVIVNANHPLAGQYLNFSVTVLDVRAATKEEVEHGHVHGVGGHHH
jgi:FKBP-type peptidyl-prolyl cis-trans isomerase SlyD